MRLTNDCYLISLRTSRVEYYFRDGRGWVKQSTKRRRFNATAEQVLNHLLPALAGVNPRVSVRVQHRDLDPDAGSSLDGLRAGDRDA